MQSTVFVLLAWIFCKISISYFTTFTAFNTSNVAPTTAPSRITTGSTAVTSVNFATSTTAAEPTPTPSMGDVVTGKLMHTTCYVCL